MSLLERQLERAVSAGQCQAIATVQERQFTASLGHRCPELDTRVHANGQRLCWTHRKAADDARRSVPLKFVGMP